MGPGGRLLLAGGDYVARTITVGGAGQLLCAAACRIAVKKLVHLEPRAALGFEQLLEGDVEATKSAQRAYARRQLTWMRRMEGICP